MSRFVRIVLASAAALLVAAALASPGGAQPVTPSPVEPSPSPVEPPGGKKGDKPTREISISYAAESETSGLQLAVTPPGATAPAGGIFGAATQSSITSDGPSATGRADALALLPAASPVSAVTQAPPDDQKEAASPFPVIAIPGVGNISALQGTAKSASEAQDESPSSTNSATLGALSVNLTSIPTLPVLGTVAGTVNVAQMSTSAESQAPKPTNVSAAAGSDGVVITADIDVSGLQAVCGPIPVGPIQQACNALAGPNQVLSVTLGPSDVRCSWNGDAADCEGAASTGTITIAGTTQQISPGQTVTIPDADPFLIRVRAGSFSETVEGDSGSAIASGFSVELIGQNRANPGLITVAVGQSTAGVSGEIIERDVIARTGGSILPMFLGGSALVVAGYGLRRYLRRR